MPAGDSLPIYITAKSDADLKADACTPLPDDTPDLSRFVVLTKRGGCLFADKQKNLVAKNATRIMYLSFGRVILTDRIENRQQNALISANSDGNVSGMSDLK